MKKQIQEIWFEAAGKCSVVAKDKDFSSDLIELKSKYSLISGGTETLVYNGEVPEELNQKMRVPYMQGEFNFPLTYGYSLVGEVQNGKNKGKYAHVMHPHANNIEVQEKDLFLLPEGASAKNATLLSNAETAINAIWDSKVELGDSVLVVGFGIIGQMVASILKHMGYSPVVSDPGKNDEVNNFELENYIDSVNGGTYDVVFHCSASEQGLQMGIDSLNTEGRLIELSWYGKKKVNLSLGGSFHYERKKIISSQVSNIPGDKKERWTYLKRKELGMELISKGVFDKIVLKEISLSECPGYYKESAENTSNTLTTIKY